jgi:hypothetical protein
MILLSNLSGGLLTDQYTRRSADVLLQNLKVLKTYVVEVPASKQIPSQRQNTGRRVYSWSLKD